MAIQIQFKSLLSKLFSAIVFIVALFVLPVFTYGQAILNSGNGIMTTSGGGINSVRIVNSSGTITNAGTITLSDSLVITGGIFQSSAANVIADNIPVRLNGGTYSTGATSGYSIPLHYPTILPLHWAQVDMS
jgi:hypothetical protein